MAEVKKEKQHISLNICDERFDIYVMPDAEGYYRDAEKLVQTTYGRFADRFRGQKRAFHRCCGPVGDGGEVPDGARQQGYRLI